jgi:hypothetical protein
MRLIFGYDGPSMMDGIEVQYNISDDAMDAWNEHVAEVERAADAVLIGEHSALVFIRAPGSSRNLDLPGLRSFAAFLAWMHRQVNTRAILPVDPSEAAAFFRQFIAQVVDSVMSADLNAVFYTRQLSVNELLLLQTHASVSTGTSAASDSSVRLSEINDEELSVQQDTIGSPNLVQADTAVVSFDSVEEGEGSLHDAFRSETDHSAPSVEDSDLASLGFSSSVEEANVDLELDGADSSVVSVQTSTAPLRARGRPRKAETPRVESSVRRSTRQHNDGMFISLPNQPSRRRSSSVSRATPPTILQIEEMQRMGIEQCLIDPSELTEERLLQDRQA